MGTGAKTLRFPKSCNY